MPVQDSKSRPPLPNISRSWCIWRIKEEPRTERIFWDRSSYTVCLRTLPIRKAEDVLLRGIVGNRPHFQPLGIKDIF
jgi:hypothetical protein